MTEQREELLEAYLKADKDVREFMEPFLGHLVGDSCTSPQKVMTKSDREKIEELEKIRQTAFTQWRDNAQKPNE